MLFKELGFYEEPISSRRLLAALLRAMLDCTNQ
jgi:hypothetical protein